MNRNLLIPLILIILGIFTWVAGNYVGDRQGGTNIALTIIGIGGGLAKQDTKAEISGDKIDTINVDEKS